MPSEPLTLAPPIGPRWATPSTDPSFLVAQFRAMSRRERREVEALARFVYDTEDPAFLAWGETAQEHPSYDSIACKVWDEMPRRWRGYATCQLITEALCGPVEGLPYTHWCMVARVIDQLRAAK